MERNKPNIELINSLVEYKDGKLFWKPRLAHMFTPTGTRSAEGCASQWNKRYAGKEAFTHVGNHGYRVGNFMNTVLLAHRVIYAMHCGNWDFEIVDHIDGNRLNNKIENLRQCSNAENIRNKAKSKGKALPKGVSAHQGKYIAYITKNYQQMYLGVFDTVEKAATAYNEAAALHHGRFARFAIV
jgi:hypothetical protein